MNPETLAIHAGYGIDPSTGAVVMPLHLTTTFERAADGSYPNGYIYIRNANPNRTALEMALAAAENGAACAAFASGLAAFNAVFQALKPGDHVLAPQDVYYGVRVLLSDLFAGWGIQHTLVDMTNLAEVEAALRPQTRLVLLESPSNPMMKINDIRAVVALARQAGAEVLVDNTIATPILQRPLDLGADYVIHATTKYIGGHSDVQGGALIARADTALFDRVRSIQHLAGAVPSPFDCWLALRGLQTLPVRMQRHAETAQKVAEFLTAHPKVEQVLHSGLASDAGHTLAASQMSGFPGLFSFLVRGGQADAMAVAACVKLFIRATSFGGAHSLIEHRASIEAPGSKTPPNLLRVAIGLEHPDDLIADLDQALTLNAQ